MPNRSSHAGARTVLLALLLAGPPPASGAPAEPPPSAGHAVLHRMIGEWTARMEVSEEEGEGTEKVRATEIVRSCCNGLFVLTDLQGKAKKSPPGGRGILGYDPTRERYILTWADSLSTSLVIGEGEYDEAGDAITFVYERPDGAGGTQQVRDRFAWEGPDRRSRTMSIIGADGAGRPLIAIDYRRR